MSPAISNVQRILVTGGCGFIGSNFIRLLLEKDWGVRKIINLDVLSYAGNPANLEDFEGDSRYEFVQGDIGNTALVGELLESRGIEAVVHFAAESHVDRSIDGPRVFFETNVLGTLSLLQAFREVWGRRSGGAAAGMRFLHVSTDEVFGSLGPEDPAFCETTPYDPRSPYSASKASSDHAVRAFHHTYGLPVLVTNCSNNYGPYQFPEKLVPLLILNALEGKKLPVYGDGMNVRDWLYVVDHCTAIWRVLCAGKTGGTYCVGGGAEKANIEVVRSVCRLLDRLVPAEGGKKREELIEFVKDRPGHDRRYAMNYGLLKEELGWEPSVSFEEGLERTVKWYLDHQGWCRDITEKRYARERLGCGR